jgi:hypothetical protein
MTLALHPSPCYASFTPKEKAAMTYKFFTTQAEAQAFLEQVRSEGFSGYWQKNNATTFEVRFW